jgi:hypothetical protein
MSHERRRSPRIELVKRLEGQSVSTGISVSVRDISLGGLSLESAAPFSTNDLHDFQLTLGDGAVMALRGRVVYSRKLTTAWSNAPLYVTGIEFVDDERGDNGGGIRQLIDRVT